MSMNHERWLVSYADFITLLFAFFVVMYSISQVNEAQYRVLSETLSATFSQPERSIDPIQIGEPVSGREPSVINTGEVPDNPMMGEGAFEQTAPLPQGIESPPESDTDSFAVAEGASPTPLSAMEEALLNEFKDLVDDELVVVSANESWLEVQLNAKILFDPASATLTLQARSIFDDIATILSPHANAISVEGFTDNTPINNARFPSNWELSAARAAAVVKRLAGAGIDPARLSAVGYGEFRPVASNQTEAGRALNRRVGLLIARELAPRPLVTPSLSTPSLSDPGDSQGRDESLSPPVQPSGTESTLSSLQQLDELNALPAATETTTLNDVLQKGDVSGAPPLRIEPVRTEGGGLLFTSDPDLLRENTTGDDN
ncbi:flagellar motor protein MotD [Marinibactrum halimedae]|nr:flagellar motor protein MotD [Marinibactrum halimedae]